MADSLTTLISKTQGALGDDGTIFTTAICTAAAREALKTFNAHLPVNAGTLIDGITNQLEYELSDEDDRAMYITDILRQDPNLLEKDKPVTFDQYSEDERIFFRLRKAVTSTDILIVRYAIPHTINGLDSETESTLPAWQDPTLIIGIAAEAARIRGRSRTETINLSKDQSDNYLQQAAEMKREFIADLIAMSRQKKAPVGEPDTRAWNDSYHSWGQ